MEQAENITLFISSPDEVLTRPFRAAVEEAVQLANDFLKAGKHRASISIGRFEDLAVDMYEDGIQSAVDNQMDAANHDMVVGLLGMKFGTPDPRLDGHTPTEHEIRRAMNARRKTGDRPRILIYIIKASPDSPTEHDQHGKVINFRDECRRLGVWTQEAPALDRFPSELSVELYGHTMDFLEKRRKQAGHVTVDCEVSGELLSVRAEGVCERLGDVIISFHRNDLNPEGGVNLAYNVAIQTQPSVNFANVIFREGQDPSNFEEPAHVNSVLLYETEEDVWARPLYGIQRANNVIRFEGVVVPAKGRGASKQRVRITNLRANASQLGVPAGQEGPIAVAVFFEPATPETPALPVRAVWDVATARPSLRFEIIRRGPSVKVPVSAEFMDACSILLTDASVKWMAYEIEFSELHKFAFKTRLEETGIAARWSSKGLRFANGTFIPPPCQSRGTRLLARFANFPQDVRLFVSRTNLSSDTSDRPVNPHAISVMADPNGAGGFVPSFVPPNDWAEVSLVGGAGQFVWEWVSALSNLDGLRHVRFGFVITSTSGSESLESAFVNGNFGPVSVTPGSSTSAPIPRFVDTATNRHLPHPAGSN